MPNIISIIIGEIPQLLKGALTTVELFVAFIFIGFILGTFLAVIEVYGGSITSLFAKLFERLFRGIPAVVLLFVFYYGTSTVVDISPFLAAVLALGLRTSAYQSQIFRGAIESIPLGQMTAGRSLGMSRLQTIRKIILPQAFRLAIGPWSNEFAAELKDTSLAYTIGVVELLRRANYIINYTYGNAVIILGLVAVIYFFLTRLGNSWLYYLERRLRVPGFESRSSQATGG